MDEFQLRVPVEVRFRDTDAMGHVNNAVYLSYLEIARMHYWDTLLGDRASYTEVPFVLARVEIDFRAPAHVGDRLTVGIRASRLGDRSFDFEYAIRRDADGVEIAVATTVQVTYDYDEDATVPLPDELRDRIERLESTGSADGPETGAR